MENNKTVEGDLKIVLEAKPLSQAGLDFLMSLDCPVNIEIKPPCDEVTVKYLEPCPVCGSTYLIKEGKCTTCYECGWSKCSL